MRFRLLSLLFLVSFFSLLGCPAPEQGIGKECQSQQDCPESLKCLKRICSVPQQNQPPIAEFVANPNPAKLGEKVVLDGQTSRDPENQPLTFQWSLTGPKDTQSKIEFDAGSKAAAFFVPDKGGIYTIQLVVNDGELNSSTSVFSVKVDLPENTRPIANAGESQFVPPLATVQLDGSKSQDPDNPGGTLKYRWSFRKKPQDSKAELTNAEIVNPTFTADKKGEYVLGLKVIDERGEESDEDVISVVSVLGHDKTPVLTKITPSEATLQTKVSMKLEGTDFVDGAILKIGNKTYSTQLVSEKELAADFELTGISPGSYKLYVENPNGKSTVTFDFTVKQVPSPVVSAISPNQAVEKSTSTIIVKGENFVSNSVIVFETTELTTTFVSDKELTAELDLTKTNRGTYTLYVKNGGLASNPKDFYVLEPGPAPELTFLNPPRGLVGTKMVFSVHGTGFDTAAVIYFNGKAIPSKRIRRDQVEADPELDLTGVLAGEYDVWVKNGDGQISEKKKFSLEDPDPIPSLDRILPFSAYVDEKLTLQVYGQKFRQGVKLFIGNTEIPGVVFKSTNYLEVPFHADSSWKVGDHFAYVESDKGKKSQTFKFTIAYRVPSISTLTPSGWSTFCGTTVTIHGNNFTTTSVVTFSNVKYSTTATDPQYKLTYISGKELRFELPKNTAVSKYKVKVENSPTAISNEETFQVLGDKAPIPDVDEIVPSAGVSGQIVDINVSESTKSTDKTFKPGAYIELNGVQQETSCNNGTSTTLREYCLSLDAKLDLTGLKTGIHKLVVVNPCGEKSATYSFYVMPKEKPLVRMVSPFYAKVGDKIRLTVTGENFSKLDKLWFGSTPLNFTFNSNKELISDQIDLTNETVSTKEITLENDEGVKSAAYKFSIVDAQPSLLIERIAVSDFEENNSYSNVNLTGSGYTSSSKVYLDGKEISSIYNGNTLLTIVKIDLNGKTEGLYELYVEDAGKKSNILMLYVKRNASPNITGISPGIVEKGKTQSPIQIKVHGDDLCKSSYTYCSSGPTMTLTDSKGKVITGLLKYVSSSSYTYRINIEFDFDSLEEGIYYIAIRSNNATNGTSRPFPILIAPPPPPELKSVNPPYAYRGNPTPQQVSLIGFNLVSTDKIVVDNDTNNPVIGQVTASGLLAFAVDISKYKYAKKLSFYVLRCEDPACSKSYKTSSVELDLRDPVCDASSAIKIDCGATLQPTNSEKCLVSSGVCRPICSVNADCTSLKGATSSAKCVGGTCQ